MHECFDVTRSLTDPSDTYGSQTDSELPDIEVYREWFYRSDPTGMDPVRT